MFLEIFATKCPHIMHIKRIKQFASFISRGPVTSAHFRAPWHCFGWSGIFSISQYLTSFLFWKYGQSPEKSKMVRKKSRLCQKVLIYRFQKSSSEALPVACRDCIQISGRQLIWLSPHVEKLKLNDESLPMHLDCETLAPPIDETKCLSAGAAVIPTREMNTLWNERL